MSMFSAYKTDAKLEQEGVWFEPSETFRVKIARAGGENKKFAKLFEQLSRPYRRAMETNQLSDKTAGKIMREAYAKSVVTDWQVRKSDDEDWQQGIEAEDGSILPFSEENVILTFEKLPNLFTAIVEFSRNMGFYLEEILETEAGN